MKISVVIPTFNEEQYLANCLKSLANQDFNDRYEIIVVDASSDRTAKTAREFGVRVLKSPKTNVSIQRQLGFEAAKGEIIATTDADTSLPANWLARIVTTFEKDKRLVGVSGPIWPKDGAISEKVLLALYNLFNFLQYLILGLSFFSGQNFAITKSAFINSGGFNPGNPSSEEGDLFNRVVKFGKVKYLPSLSVSISMRRLRTHGWFKQIWWGISAWLSLNLNSKIARPELAVVRAEPKASKIGRYGYEIAHILTLTVLIFAITMIVMVIWPAVLAILTYKFKPSQS